MSFDTSQPARNAAVGFGFTNQATPSGGLCSIALTRKSKESAMRILTIAAIALAALTLPAAAATKHHQHMSHAARASYAAQPEIACSPYGCAPVPRGCHRASGRTFDGSPTGFDIADCGSYTLYGNR
jgi:hypothetical protein